MPGKKVLIDIIIFGQNFYYECSRSHFGFISPLRTEIQLTRFQKLKTNIGLYI